MGLFRKAAVGAVVATGVAARRKRASDGPTDASSAQGRVDAARGGEVPPQQDSGPGPDGPLDLPPPDWKTIVRRTVREIKDDRVPLIAAAMAYYLFLALFPAVIAVVGVLGLADVSSETIGRVADSMRTLLPGGAGDVLADAVVNAGRSSESASLVAALLGVAAAVWSASSGMVALQAGLNVAYDVTEERRFVKKRLVAFGLLVTVVLLGGVPSPFFAFGDGVVFDVLAWTLTLGALATMFAIFYFVGPNRETPSWRWVSPGGVVAVALWALASIGFSFYVSNVGSYGRTYGSLAGVIVLVLLLYLSSFAILVGGELNAEVERQAELRARAAGRD